MKLWMKKSLKRHNRFLNDEHKTNYSGQGWTLGNRPIVKIQESDSRESQQRGSLRERRDSDKDRALGSQSSLSCFGYNYKALDSLYPITLFIDFVLVFYLTSSTVLKF